MGRPRITTPFEVRIIVTSTWRNRFMAAWKLLKFLSHATDTRISVCTTRNRLRGARLIFELWNLNFNIDHFVYFWWSKRVYFRNVLLKMFTFVWHYMNFIFSKVFVIVKTVLQNYCTQCLYWLNFFFWVYIDPPSNKYSRTVFCKMNPMTTKLHQYSIIVSVWHMYQIVCTEVLEQWMMIEMFPYNIQIPPQWYKGTTISKQNPITALLYHFDHL